MFSERIRARLEDIVQDVARAQAFLDGMEVIALAADERTMLAIERLLQSITEPTVQINSDEMARIAPDAPARQVNDFGNLLRHQCSDIDPGVVYTIVRDDLPPLAIAAARALSEG